MHITVCICTRNRGDRITRTLRSIAASDHTDFDVIVVDQSVGDETMAAVQRATSDDARFRYISSESTGASVARNVATSWARGPLIAFTDDDCEVSRVWLSRLDRHFAAHPEVGQICGAVWPGRHDRNDGFVPDYDIHRMKRISSRWLKWREGGIGANMAFRLDVLKEVGPFDEVLGPGAPLHNCEDGDMTYRVLKMRRAVMSVPDAYVVHYGFRNWDEGQVLMRHAGLAVAAAYMKHLRLGDVAVVPTLLYEWLRCITWWRLLLLRPHVGFGRLLAYTSGLGASFRFKIDRDKCIYIRPPDAGPLA